MLRPKTPGFTLLETLIVLSILSIAFTIIPPKLNAVIDNTRIKSTVRQLAASLHETRSLSITNQQEKIFSLYLNDSIYAFEDNKRTINVPSNTIIKLTTASTEILSDNAGSIRFYPDGSSTGGQITIERGPLVYQINVNWLTGRILITP